MRREKEGIEQTLHTDSLPPRYCSSLLAGELSVRRLKLSNKLDLVKELHKLRKTLTLVKISMYKYRKLA